MPELPEVITIRNDLRKEVLGKKVVKILSMREENMEDFEKYVGNHTIDEVSNIAKLLILKMSSGHFIATHLNMSGILLLNNKDPYVKTTLIFEDGSHLNYSTVRMFGYFEVWPEHKINEYKKKYGKEIIDSSITSEEFMDEFKKRKTNIKTALLNQKIFSGIGNIYANDALFMSGIHPKKKVGKISESLLEKLYENLKLVINEGIKNRGSSIDRYRDLYGKPGFQQNHFRIYGKKDQKCPNCSTEVTFEKLNGRGTYYCTVCQPEDDQIAMFNS